MSIPRESFFFHFLFEKKVSFFFGVEKTRIFQEKKRNVFLTVSVDVDRPEPVPEGDVRGFVFFAEHEPDKVLIAPVFLNLEKKGGKKRRVRGCFSSSSSSKGEKNLKKNLKKKLFSHPPVDPARERPRRLREDPVDDTISQAVVAVAEEVFFREKEVVVGVELLFRNLIFFGSFFFESLREEKSKGMKKG